VTPNLKGNSAYDKNEGDVRLVDISRNLKKKTNVHAGSRRVKDLSIKRDLCPPPFPQDVSVNPKSNKRSNFSPE